MAYAERRYNREDVESDEEDGEAIVLGYSEGDSEEGGNSRECNVS